MGGTRLLADLLQEGGGADGFKITDWFIPSADNAQRLGQAALEASRLGDPGRLPLERRTLLEVHMVLWMCGLIGRAQAFQS